MPAYGSVESPSLRKMDYRTNNTRKRMSLGNVIGDPFALATVSIALLSWVIAFIGSIIGQVNSVPSDPDRMFPTFVWWAVVFMIFLIPGTACVVAANAVQTYHVALTGYMAAGLVLTSSSVNSLIYSGEGSRQAAAAGFILLSIINILWIFYFGSAPSGVARAYIDSFALQKEATMSMSRQTMNGYGGRPETSTSVQPPQMYTSAQLNGFENPSPVGGLNGAGPRNSSPAFPAPGGGVKAAPQAPEPELAAPTEYPYRAKAIYSYEANPEDANEISFSKHEILEVSDVSGRWWQARKETGETGIAPSNYLILL